MTFLHTAFLLVVASVVWRVVGSAQDSSNAQRDIVINFAGDCTFADYFEEYVGDRFEHPFGRLGWFAEADISMVNLENAITMRDTKISKQYNFRMHPSFLKVLLHGGIDIVTLANNHVYDFGNEGLFDTIGYLDSVGIKHVGAGRNIIEARRPEVFDVRGVKIGFLGYYGDGDWHPATQSDAGTAPRYRDDIQEDITRLRTEEKVDVVVVNYHWGEEKSNYPTEYQMDLGRFTIDAGADLVIGHHPHVLQGIERYKYGIIVYSLGNFIFGGHSRTEYDTAVFQVRIRNKQIMSKLIPIHVSNWQPYQLDGQEGKHVVQQIVEYSKIFKQTIFD